jgi:hypothetical protein
MNTHGIPAAPWQLQAAAEERLKAIVLPLTGGWVSGDPSTWPPIEALGSGYEVGNRLYLQEEWGVGFEDNALEDYDYKFHLLSKQTHPRAEKIWCWQPAETMPPEAAQHWFEVTGVRVAWLAQLGEIDVEGIMGQPPHSTESSNYGLWRERWNAAHPEYPWADDRYVALLNVKAIALLLC